MNRTAMLPLCLLALWLTACGTAESAAPAAAPTAAPEPTPTETPAPPAEPAAPYSDLRYLPWLDEYAQQTYQPGEYTAEDLYTYTYNTGTVFAGAEDEAAALLEEDKDPGLGVRGLQAQGITGKGVRGTIVIKSGKDRISEIEEHCAVSWSGNGSHLREAARIEINSTDPKLMRVTIARSPAMSN